MESNSLATPNKVQASSQSKALKDMLEHSDGRYPEKALQLAAIGWLKRQRGFAEKYADEEARGARVDSVGVLDGRLALIEVKVSVTADIVEHRPDRSHSLESKIAGTLGPLYRREASPVAQAGNSVWDRRHAPIICILAKSFTSAGLVALAEMLNRRSKEWCFDFLVWQWTGEVVEVLARSDQSPQVPSSFEAGRL